MQQVFVFELDCRMAAAAGIRRDSKRFLLHLKGRAVCSGFRYAHLDASQRRRLRRRFLVEVGVS